MRQIAWDDSYKMGIEFIDKDHKILFSTMNKLLKISEDQEKNEWVCREGVKFLKNHSIEHFEREEVYMKSIGYDEYDIHKRLHDNFREKTLPALEKEMEEMHYSTESVRHFLGVCIGWVISHTLTEDMAIHGISTSKWTNIPHEREQEALEQTIIQICRDIFRMKAKMISEQYGGQDFGKVICCRFIYRGHDKKKWEVILVYEERLLLKIMSGILNMEYPRVDDMAINVCRYISRQFIERVRESFPELELFELEKESLLTHEQLLDSFEREHPSCSLLFDTGTGYFAFCAMTADSIHGKIASAINDQNAIDMVNKYLIKEDKEWKEHKKRILVVDDSDFMRKRIIQLLEKDYAVIEAGSGASAIQSIVVNRPDLVLLDYEMPVCDGRQALEMIRSEKATASIPVIFLTGKGDVESVKKVMALKPEGYLLKTLPEDDIKKAIDKFFAKFNEA
ncbi:MAG: response regulator [Lachnospiraceae bacterium]|nr:response regulator [Lachnospiraceae bacterium]